jgi:DNA adenine methylase
MILHMRYPGGKGKVYQQIINVLPPHATYIETHLGGGAVLRHKKPAQTNIGIDLDPSVIGAWRQQFPLLADFIEADAIDFLTSRQFAGDEVIYCDPPYLPSTRRRSRIYRCEYSELDHIRLLETLRRINCRVVVSGYPSDLYDESLRGWNTRSFPANSHHGVRSEQIWFNFDPPAQLHDASYLGRDFRERETIKRRVRRVQKRIAGLSSQEQYSIADWLDDRLSSGWPVKETFCNLDTWNREPKFSSGAKRASTQAFD